MLDDCQELGNRGEIEGYDATHMVTLWIRIARADSVSVLLLQRSRMGGCDTL